MLNLDRLRLYILNVFMCLLFATVFNNYHLKHPPSITSNVKFMDNLSKMGSNTRGKFNLTAIDCCSKINNTQTKHENFIAPIF